MRSGSVHYWRAAGVPVRTRGLAVNEIDWNNPAHMPLSDGPVCTATGHKEWGGSQF